MNYFRTTAYNKTENYSVILDSYGFFDAIWQFCSFLISKGFSTFFVGNQDKFGDENIPKVKEQTTKLNDIFAYEIDYLTVLFDMF